MQPGSQCRPSDIRNLLAGTEPQHNATRSGLFELKLLNAAIAIQQVYKIRRVDGATCGCDDQIVPAADVECQKRLQHTITQRPRPPVNEILQAPDDPAHPCSTRSQVSRSRR